MPNWAMCELTITGDASELDHFADAAQDIDADGATRPLRLQRLVPMPSELENTDGDANGKEPNWYQWRLQNWGTKWDYGSRVSVKRMTNTKLFYSFESAWCGPAEAIPTISVAFPLLRFQLRHADDCMDWDQTVVCRNGKVIESIERTFDNPDVREHWGLPECCDECGNELEDCECQDTVGDQEKDEEQAE
jgi:hypothetical protein